MERNDADEDKKWQFNAAQDLTFSVKMESGAVEKKMETHMHSTHQIKNGSSE
jgi:hypothetical protein